MGKLAARPLSDVGSGRTDSARELTAEGMISNEGSFAPLA